MNNRMLRADSEIQKKLTEIIKTELNDPRFKDIISITWTRTSSDFTYCKAGVSIYNSDHKKREEIVSLLNKSSGFIKRKLVETLNLRNVPNLVFELDDGFFYEDKISKILESLKISSKDN